MPRQKLSEYRAKDIVFKALKMPYNGLEIDAQKSLEPQLEKAGQTGNFVVKVDQGVKGRFKKGLVALNVSRTELAKAVEAFKAKGYRWLIAEPMVEHDQKKERYLAVLSDRQGLVAQFSANGGINIEDQAATLQRLRLGDKTDWEGLAEQTGLSNRQLKSLAQVFKDNYFVFMEINPYLADKDKLQLLDLAVEVDDAASFFVDSWQPDDFRNFSGHDLTEEEKTVRELNDNSPASLNLSLLEPHGSVFLLLSGGGASVVVADEVYNQGFGKQLANYGEYSGNPNAEETYIYTQQLLRLLLKSKASKKVLFIGGAVANFTDVAKTFDGIIKAIDEVAPKLAKAQVKVFVRRGGPNQEKGLANMEAALQKHGILGAVHSPETSLPAAVTEALQELGK